MEPTWKIDWDYQGWRVELTRYPSPEEYVSVELKTDGISGRCIIYGTRIDTINPPWPWRATPTNPAEVCAMCERLADQYTISPTPTER